MKQEDSHQRSSPADSPAVAGPWRWVLAGAILLAVIAVSFWASWSAAPAPARAAVPPGTRLIGSGEQRATMVAELKMINARLDKLQRLLSSGEVKVVVVKADKTDEGAPNVLLPKTKR